MLDVGIIKEEVVREEVREAEIEAEADMPSMSDGADMRALACGPSLSLSLSLSLIEDANIRNPPQLILVLPKKV